MPPSAAERQDVRFSNGAQQPAATGHHLRGHPEPGYDFSGVKLPLELEPLVTRPALPVYGHVNKASLLGKKGCLSAFLIFFAFLLCFIVLLIMRAIWDSEVASTFGIAVTCTGVFWTLWQVYWSPRARDLMAYQLMVANRHASTVSCMERLQRCQMASEQAMTIASIRPMDRQLTAGACRELDRSIRELMECIGLDSSPHRRLSETRHELHVVNNRLCDGPPEYRPLRTLGELNKTIGEMVVVKIRQDSGAHNE